MTRKYYAGGDKPKPPGSALSSAAGTSIDQERVKRLGWRKQHILVVALDEPRINDTQREMVRHLGDALYGEG